MQYEAKLFKLLDNYDKAYLFCADNVGSKQFMDIRAVSPDSPVAITPALLAQAASRSSGSLLATFMRWWQRFSIQLQNQDMVVAIYLALPRQSWSSFHCALMDVVQSVLQSRTSL